MGADQQDGKQRLSSRRRRRYANPISRRHTVFDWIVISLVLCPGLLGGYLMGGSRLWAIAPLLMLSYVGIALFFIRPLVKPELNVLRVPPGGWLLLSLCLYAAGRIRFSPIQYEAGLDLLMIFSYVGAYWAWTELAYRYKRWRIVFGILIFSVTLMCWYAIIQHSHGSNMVIVTERPETYGMRASSTYICPNHFANVIELVIPLSVAFLVSGVGGVILRVLSAYSLFLFLPVIFLTQSRSGWISAIVGMSVTVCFLFWKKNKKLFFTALVVIPLIVAVLVTALWMGSDIFKNRVEEALQGNIRIQMWQDTLSMIKDHPVYGIGGGAYRWVYPEYRSLPVQLFFRYAHNEYLHFTAEYGLIGAALLGLAVVSCLIVFMRSYMKAEGKKEIALLSALFGVLAAAAAHACFDFNFHLFPNTHVVILIAGVVSANLYNSSLLEAKKLRKARVVYSVLGVGVVLVALMFTIQYFLGYALTSLADKHREHLELDRAEEQYALAARIHPENWKSSTGLGHVYKTRAFWDLDKDMKTQYSQQAIEWYQLAVEGNPYDMESVYGLSQAWRIMGDQEKALDYLQQTVDHDPYHLFYVSHLGLQLRRMGRYDEALEVFAQAGKIEMTDMVRINLQTLREMQAGKPRQED